MTFCYDDCDENISKEDILNFIDLKLAIFINQELLIPMLFAEKEIKGSCVIVHCIFYETCDEDIGNMCELLGKSCDIRKHKMGIDVMFTWV